MTRMNSGAVAETTAATAYITLPCSCIAQKAADFRHHGPVFLGKKKAREGKIVVGEKEAEKPGRDHPRPHDRYDHISEGLEPGAAIDHRTLIQILRDVEEEGMQHPQCKRLIDCHHYDDGCRQMSPEIHLEERQKITGHQCDVRHGAIHQRDDQDPERIAETGSRELVSTKRAKCQGNRHDAERHQPSVHGRCPEFLLDPCAFITAAGKPPSGFSQRSGPVEGISPVLP